MDEQRYANAILEEMREQLKAVLEVSYDTRELVKNTVTKDEFNDLVQDVQLIKRAVTDTNHDLLKLE